MGNEIKRVAVLGAGVMGAGIAAHMANADIPCVLLDIVPRELLPAEEGKKASRWKVPQVRNRFAINGKTGALKSKPASFYSANDAGLVTVGNFDDNMDLLSDCDLIVEAVVENLGIKQSLFKRVAEVRKPRVHRGLEYLRYLG